MHLHFAQGDTQDTTYVAYLSCVTNVSDVQKRLNR